MTFTELWNMTMGRLLMLKQIKDDIIEERNKAQEEAEKNGGGTNKISASSSMSQVRSLASKYGVSMPSMPSGMPHL